MSQKSSSNIIIAVIVVLLVIVAGYFILGGNAKIGPNNKISQISLKNKKVSDIMKLNSPAECDLVGLLAKARATRKKNEGIQVPTKLFIKGNTVRQEGVSIFTDGTEKGTVDIINTQNKTFFTLLLDGSNGMASLNYDLVGGYQKVAQYDNISQENLDCKSMAFNEKLLVPQNVCYMPPSKNTPICH